MAPAVRSSSPSRWAEYARQDLSASRPSSSSSRAIAARSAADGLSEMTSPKSKMTVRPGSEMGARVTPDTVPGDDPTLRGGIRSTRYERFHADPGNVPAGRADAGSQAEPARRADATAASDSARHQGDAEYPRQNAVAAGLLAGRRDRTAAADDRGKMAGTMTDSATGNDTVTTEKTGSKR